MKQVLATAVLAAAGDAKVLITGESGVGKDLLAREIHARSRRAQRRFIAINCAGLTETLLESELFGHVKGSFTGAYRDKVGQLLLADHGTLFLDEVGDMSLRMQALMLRFLESGELRPVGAGDAGTKVNVRLISATNRNLAEMVSTGQFREDLLYRLRVIHIHVPPLRERREDIRPLVSHLVAQIARPVVYDDEALRALERYRWPGNVRELQNAIEQTTWLSPGPTITVEHLPPSLLEASEHLVPVRERRCQVADDLYDAVVHGGYTFWEHIYPLFLGRNITRHDVRELVRLGLRATGGNYRPLLKLFGMPERDYKRFLNFLNTHGCRVDFRGFRDRSPDRVGAPPLTLGAPEVPEPFSVGQGSPGLRGPRQRVRRAFGSPVDLLAPVSAPSRKLPAVSAAGMGRRRPE
jgi:DNA-binding NtrC family response regulator